MKIGYRHKLTTITIERITGYSEEEVTELLERIKVNHPSVTVNFIDDSGNEFNGTLPELNQLKELAQKISYSSPKNN
ncbi:hypothetical protein GCM10028807_58010 [Spirosoma daeguense]